MQNNQSNSFDNNKLPEQRYSNSMQNIEYINIYEQATSGRVLPRQVATGNTRGQQQIYGTQMVRDLNQNVRVVIGYQENGF